MNDSIKQELKKYEEMLSALMDGELSSQELDALMEAMSDNPELEQKWLRLNRVSQSISDPMSYAHSSNPETILSNLREQIAGEKPHKAEVISFSPKRTSDNEEKESKPFFQSLVQFSVAASVMLVAVFTWNFAGQDSNEYLAGILNNAEQQESVALNRNVQNVDLSNIRQQAKTDYGVLVSSDAQRIQSTPDRFVSRSPLDRNNQSPIKTRELYLSEGRMQQYFMLHAAHASLNSNQGMMPFARVSHLKSENSF